MRKFKFLFFILIYFFLLQKILAEVPSSYLLPITRTGVTETRVARNFWSGEYPAPIIDVKSKTKGTTKIKVFKSLREKSNPIDCTIINAIYHPWSKSKGSLIEFYQLAPNREFLVLKETKLDSTPLKKGDRIAREIYLAEGNCEGVLIQNKKKERRIEYTCESIKHADFSAINGKDDKFEEQWLFVNCKEGFKAFIQDADLQKTSGVSEGQLVNYGEVKGSNDSGK